MKQYTLILLTCLMIFGCSACSEDSRVANNSTALDEQAQTERNQQVLFTNQPPPRLSWSLERDNLIKRFKLMNDRSIMFYMYIFIEGQPEPVGYYQVNKVSSVNSQLTNTEQIASWYSHGSRYYEKLPSPAEDGSYGSNGEGVFGFTPEDIYIEHNMKYIVSTVPLSFQHPVQRLTILSVETEKQLKDLMKKVNQ